MSTETQSGESAILFATIEKLRAENAGLRGALQPFASFIEQYDRKPLRYSDEFFMIHSGTEFEASLKLSDMRKALKMLSRP